MFESLTDRLGTIFSKLKSRGKLSEKEIEKGMREIRLALLEADVNYKVAKQFTKDVQIKAMGKEVQKSLTPGQQIIKIVNQELITLMKSDSVIHELPKNRLSVIMIVGLQGSGKTTTCAKLALKYKKEKYSPLLVAADIYRPAAVKQLETLGKSIDVPVFSDPSKKLSKIAKNSLKFAEKNDCNLIIFDTAGRLHIDDMMMKELEEVEKIIKPHEIFFVADSMTGQDAVNSAREFNSRLNISGIILTKLDGDARGGAALSIKAITKKPIRFVGVGEKLNDLETFHADRITSRILGMGDMLSLIEKAESAYDVEEAKKLQTKLRKNLFTLEDFHVQLQKIKKMGPMGDLLKMLPGSNSKLLKNTKVDEHELDHVEAIIFSMTPNEKIHPNIINGNRRRRIATGSGTTLQQVNRLLKQFDSMKKMMKNLNKSKGNFPMGNQFFPMG
ncbi:MAG: signal recognition particle protein [Candidatus Cloacimonadota bacterium]|nr:signal recognition particle protein [Candidatus Cloacimonadota bacterium]